MNYDFNINAISDASFSSTTAEDNREEIGVSSSDTTIAPDFREAQRFLRLLDSHAQSFTFQTFDDDKHRKLPELVRVFHGELKNHFDKLAGLNRSGAGIFVAVQETDLTGRKAENIKRIRAIYADLDSGKPANLPLAPSIVVESSPGKFQYYWKCEGITSDEFAMAMGCLIRDHGADHRAKCITRVLRLPGFDHRKAEPLRVTIRECNGKVYARDEILASFPTSHSKSHPVPATPLVVQSNPPSTTRRAFDPDKLHSALDHIPADDYRVWRDVGFALHFASDGSEEGFAFWEEWSRRSRKFCPKAVRELWDGSKTTKAKPITVGTIYYLALKAGWTASRTSISWPVVDKNGTPLRDSHRNIQAALESLDIDVSFDAFLSEVVVRCPGSVPKPMCDASLLALWFRVEDLGLRSKKTYFTDAIAHLAAENASNVCVGYFDGLQWDGKPRINELLIRYCDAVDTEFNRAIGRKFLIAAVRRVKHPGVKFDNMLTLEGPQGAGKSSFARILASDDWFTDCVNLGDDPKIIAEQTRGKMIVELPELVGIKKKETERIKSMLTRLTDRARMAYGRTASNFQRQFVFIGTTNADKYLLDPTGNRRYWPVQVSKIDLKGLAEDRDQLWAEAVLREAEGEDLWLPKHLEAAAAEAQRARELVNPQEERLRELVSDMYGIIPKEELFAAIGLDAHRTSNRNSSHELLIDRVMKAEGWESTRIRKSRDSSGTGDDPDNRVRVFKRDTPEGLGGAWLSYDSDARCFSASGDRDFERFSQIAAKHNLMNLK